MTSPPLPAYSAEALSALAVPDLIGLMKGDEDRVPRNLIDECARRGEKPPLDPEIPRRLRERLGRRSSAA